MTLPTGRTLLDATKILQRVGLVSNMNFADLGAGTLGHLVLPASQMVGEDGKVYAVDILKSALEAIESRARLVDIHNIETVWGNIEKVDGIKIPSDSIDVLSLVNNIDLIKKSPSVLKEVKRLLNQKGVLLLVDWYPNSLSFGLSQKNRLSSAEAQSLLQENGFVIIDDFKAGSYHWGIIAMPTS